MTRRAGWGPLTGLPLIGLALAPLLAAAQGPPLTLADAFRRADAGAYANRIAAGEVQAQAGEGMRALAGILPAVRVDAGYARTTDPIGAFGTTLRQRSITQQDFDPARLNHPDAIANYTGALVLEQPLLNLDAHFGRRAAAHGTAAREAMKDWTQAGTRVDVVRAYYGGVLAREQVVTLEAAHEAARAHVRQAESMLAQGMVTRSDVLLAEVKAGELETQLVEARGEAALVKRRVAVLLGEPADTAFLLPDRLPESKRIMRLDTMRWTPVLQARADLVAATEGHAAARADVQRAQSLYLPRLNGMARFDWNSADVPFEGRENWSLGVVASWSPFAGATQLAERRAAGGREQSARAQLEAAQAQAELDAVTRENDWRVALERLRIADRAVEQSVEAHRIVTRKYEGGLATVVELLGAQAAETEARLRLVSARYLALVAAAERLRALGHDPVVLASWAD